MAFCRKCGAELREGLKFCSKCGNPIEIISKASSQSPQELYQETNQVYQTRSSSVIGADVLPSHQESDSNPVVVSPDVSKGIVQAIGSIIVLVVIGCCLWAVFGGRVKETMKSVTGTSTTIGESSGIYQTVDARALNAHKFDYLGKKIKVVFRLLSIDIESNYMRLELCPRFDGKYAADGVRILVSESSPMYDQLVKLNPQLDQKFTVYGTVFAYSNSFDSVYIVPDKITFP